MENVNTSGEDGRDTVKMRSRRRLRRREMGMLNCCRRVHSSVSGTNRLGCLDLLRRSLCGKGDEVPRISLVRFGAKGMLPTMIVFAIIMKWPDYYRPGSQ